MTGHDWPHNMDLNFDIQPVQPSMTDQHMSSQWHRSRGPVQDMIDQTSANFGQTLSVDWQLILALIMIKAETFKTYFYLAKCTSKIKCLQQ